MMQIKYTDTELSLPQIPPTQGGNEFSHMRVIAKQQ